MTRCVMLVLVAILLGAHGARADVSTLLDQAAVAYAEGARLLPRDDAGARAAFARSAGAYREAIEELGPGRAAPQLLANAGSASVLAGDPGAGVLWLKRAERLSPNDARVRADLAGVRQRVAMPVHPPGGVLQQLTILEFVPAGARLWAGVGAFAAAWVLALWRLWVPSWRPARTLVGGCAVLSVVAAGSLVPRELRLREGSEAVVMTETTGRAGPDSVAYEPKPAAPIKAGAEARIIEERGAWTLVELGDASTTWVESKAIERVAIPGV
jgi:hypothetical protein